MSKARDNHYVPQWYQRGFLPEHQNKLCYLDLHPDTRKLDNGEIIAFNDRRMKPTSQCFFQTDLYTTIFGKHINDEIERKLFGKIDTIGAKAVRAFIGEDVSEWHYNFQNFFSYIDSQKLRTPKGLDWLSGHYPNLCQVELMVEMQAIKNLHCTIWGEGVREIISAKKSSVKFIISDHPVTVYNYAYPPDSKICKYPNDPSITLKGSQTIFPLDMDHCIILTNYEYAEDPYGQDPTVKRTNATPFRESLLRTDAFIKTRYLGEDDIRSINFILKSRARRYIASASKDSLYPEKFDIKPWSDLRGILLPPDDERWRFGGEMFVGYKDGSKYYQDAFGRTTPENKHLKKSTSEKTLGKNDHCGCGSGKKYKKCCMVKPKEERTSWGVLSIRERNIIFFNATNDILGLSKDKSWDDVRRELSNKQVQEIHELYGYLWPPDTDLFSLLPKSEFEFRALYTGTIDPRVITKFAIGLVPYFDEIIIQHPFINPHSVNPEYSPTKSPHQFKIQTLKNLFLLFTLMPFIDNGFINFIPDPCSFNQHLHRQMLNMARARSSNHKIDEKEYSQFMALKEEDFIRNIYMLPRDYQIRQITKAMPKLAPSKIESVIQYIEKLKKEDPFILLQENIYGGEAGGQLSTFHMQPNFEMSLYISQLTRSVIFTDSPTRWKEITNSQHKELGLPSHPWTELTSKVNKLNFPLSLNPELTFNMRFDGKYQDTRKAFRSLLSTVRGEAGEPDNRLIENLVSEFVNGHNRLNLTEDDLNDYGFFGKFLLLIPKGGFAHNNVQRLLLASGAGKNINHVPMAIFAEDA